VLKRSIRKRIVSDEKINSKQFNFPGKAYRMLRTADGRVGNREGGKHELIIAQKFLFFKQVEESVEKEVTKLTQRKNFNTIEATHKTGWRMYHGKAALRKNGKIFNIWGLPLRTGSTPGSLSAQIEGSSQLEPIYLPDHQVVQGGRRGWETPL